MGPGKFILDVLAATAAAVGVMVLCIVLRRLLRRRYFQRRERREREIQRDWQRILNGGVPPTSWLGNSVDRAIIEDIVIERLDANFTPGGRLQAFARNSGLVERRLAEVTKERGWRRQGAMLALGRMRLPESIPVLKSTLRERDPQTVIDAVRSLGYIGTPEAGAAILEALSAGPIPCPAQALQSSLLQCYRSGSSQLLARTLEAGGWLRPLLARVLAEAAGPATQGSLAALVCDSNAEVRAQAARAIVAMRPPDALASLSKLAGDDEWFVRLRAAIAIGELQDFHGIPLLIHALTDRNRFVRLRAAAALVRFQGEEEHVLRLAMHTHDRYAVEALVSELQRADRISELAHDLAHPARGPRAKRALLAALEGGSFTMLIDIALRDPDWRTRKNLARLLAGSDDGMLLERLKQVQFAALTPRQRRIVFWMAARLRNPRTVAPAETAMTP